MMGKKRPDRLLGGLDRGYVRDARQRRPSDARLVEHLRPHHPRASREVREELLALLAYPPAHHYHVRPEEVLYPVEVLVEALGVLLPAEVLALARAVRGTVFGLFAPHFDVTELGVGQEASPDEQGGAYPRAEREHQHHAALDHGREAAPHRTTPPRLLHHPHRRLDDSLRGCGLGGLDAHPLG